MCMMGSFLPQALACGRDHQMCLHGSPDDSCNDGKLSVCIPMQGAQAQATTAGYAPEDSEMGAAASEHFTRDGIRSQLLTNKLETQVWPEQLHCRHRIRIFDLQ